MINGRLWLCDIKNADGDTHQVVIKMPASTAGETMRCKPHSVKRAFTKKNYGSGPSGRLNMALQIRVEAGTRAPKTFQCAARIFAGILNPILYFWFHKCLFRSGTGIFLEQSDVVHQQHSLINARRKQNGTIFLKSFSRGRIFVKLRV
jgi:hypothetical protein